MTAITIDAEAVRVMDYVQLSVEIAGEDNITRGLPLYRGDDGRLYISSRSADTTDHVDYFAFSHGDEDEKIVAIAAKDGAYIGLGSSALVAGTTYALGTSGAIVPYADLTTGNRKTLLGTAYNTEFLRIAVDRTGIVSP